MKHKLNSKLLKRLGRFEKINRNDDNHKNIRTVSQKVLQSLNYQLTESEKNWISIIVIAISKGFRVVKLAELKPRSL